MNKNVVSNKTSCLIQYIMRNTCLFRWVNNKIRYANDSKIKTKYTKSAIKSCLTWNKETLNQSSEIDEKFISCELNFIGLNVKRKKKWLLSQARSKINLKRTRNEQNWRKNCVCQLLPNNSKSVSDLFVISFHLKCIYIWEWESYY